MLTSIKIGFANDFSNTHKISLQETQIPLAEHFQIWIFDLYYAKTLHTLTLEYPDIARKLQEDLDAWGIQFSSKIFLPMEKILEAGLERIDKNLILVTEDIQFQDYIFEIKIEYPEGEWPAIYTIDPPHLNPELKSHSVKILAQYYFIKNKLFRRELPIHLLALRKFYTDSLSPEHAHSMLEAPLYALNKAMEYFQAAKNNHLQNN